MTPSTQFEKHYAMLNTMQRKAVDTIEGPVMVIAGPGTGKTQILTLRIANIMRNTDVPADAILALTFTNAAATNMRKRLVEMVGSEGYRVSIFTFHSFANHLIETYPQQFSSVTGFSNCSEVERIDIVRLLLDQGKYEEIKPLNVKYHHVPAILSAISHLKREGVTPEKFLEWIKAEEEKILHTPDLHHTKGAHKGKIKAKYQKALNNVKKHTELAHMYSRYQEELQRRHRYDFDDSLLTLIQAMEKNEDFLRELQEEYQYFLVDEHQDTNGAQNRILELLVTFFEAPNLFVVGDEKQAIFRFQGASLANFLYFEKKFKDVARITLETNYRSHQGVLDAADALIAQSKDTIRAPLTAYTPTPQQDTRIKVYQFSADDEELLFLAESVQKQIKEGVVPHDIAVLYRTNRDAEAIVDYFERLGIPFLIESGYGVLDDPDVRKLNNILVALNDLSNDESLAKVLFIDFFHIAIGDVYTILHAARKQKKSIYHVLLNAHTLSLEDSAHVKTLARNLTRWKTLAENDAFLRAFEAVVRESGLLTHIQHSSFHTEKFDKIVQLFDEIKAHVHRTPFFSLAEYHTFLTILAEHHLTLEAKSRQIPNAVRLMTAHKAKGLEFDYVYVVHAHDGQWGGKRSSHYFSLPYSAGDTLVVGDDMEDERRLFYVALTRARKDVYITYSTHAPDGRDRVPSQFIEEIQPNLRTLITGESLGYAQKRPPLFVERKGRRGAEKYREFVRAEFDTRGISATALNNFLTCPWKWFYESFFHIQFLPTPAQIKGTAVHQALQDYFNERNTHPDVPKDYLLHQCTHYITESEIEPHTQERIIRDTISALSGWYDTWHNTWREKTINELSIKGVLLDDVLLTGKLDKLECVDDSCKEVVVVDYKTGKPKSRNAIEGKTKSAQQYGGAGYKRQLVFYQILLNRFMDGAYTMKEGILDFIEPTVAGNYKKESFVITQDETCALEEEVRNVAQAIRTLSFWNERCGERNCTACALREQLES